MLRAASSFYTAQQQRALEVMLTTRGLWGKLSKPADFDRIFAKLYAVLLAGQLGAARDGAAYVGAALEEQGFDPGSPLQVNPAGFAAGYSYSTTNPGLARPMESLLRLVPDRAAQIAGGAEQQLAWGGRLLDTIARTQVAMSGQFATGAGIASRVKVGYYRHVSPPCCADCAVQAGKFFRHNAGFARHPHCDCVHAPAYEDKPPAGYADPPPLDQVTGLSEAERQAVEDGGSLSMVVNARRGVTGMTTIESTTKRGYATYLRRAIDRELGQPTAMTGVNVGRRGAVRSYTVRRTGARLTPEGIYAVASTQEEAVQLLIRNGYVVGDIGKLAKSAAAQMRRATY